MQWEPADELAHMAYANVEWASGRGGTATRMQDGMISVAVEPTLNVGDRSGERQLTASAGASQEDVRCHHADICFVPNVSVSTVATLLL